MEARPRAAWLASAGLLLCAGLAAGWATYLSWLPCRGAMLVGTILESGDAEVPEACYERMDLGLPYEVGLADPASLVNDFTALALLAGALSWLVLVTGRPWGRVERWCVLAPAVALGLAAVVAWLAGPAGVAVTRALLLVDVGILAAASALAARLTRGDRGTPWLWVPLLAVGTLGISARVGDFLAMVMWSELNWDTPPGTGYLGAGALIVAAVVMAFLTPCATPRIRDTVEDHGQRARPEVGSLPA